LSGPLLTDDLLSIFEDARLEPFLDQPDDARVADPMLYEANQPALADFVEGRYGRLPISGMFRVG
jgi:hypothetical protein